jgi:ElaB/YqjD/DUF883 family membrane-anchored ribosome-binding protein
MDIEQDIKEPAEEMATGFKEKFNKGADAAKKYANQAKDAAKEYATKAKDMTEGQIKDNPFWSMLVAMGVGMTIGVLFTALFMPKREEF